MKPILVSMSLVLWAGFAGPVRAEAPAVDLGSLLDEAMRESPRLTAMERRVESAGAVVGQRESLPDPVLQASYTNDGLSDFTLGTSEFANLTIGWEQEVPRRVARDRAAAAADADAQVVRASTASARAAIRARVIELYTALWRADRTLALLAEGRTLLQAAASAAQARYESGEGIQEGVIRAQSALRTIDLEIDETGLGRRQAEIALAAEIGRMDDATFPAVDDLPAIDGKLDVESLLASAGAASPELGESAARERAAQAALEEARTQTKPGYSWMAAYQNRGGLDPMVMGGVSMRLPVRKNRNQDRLIAGAGLAAEAAAKERDDARIRVAARIRSQAAEIASLDARLSLYTEAIVPQRVAAYESANAAFSSGRAEMSLVLDDLERSVRAREDALALEARRVEAAASLEAMTGATLLSIAPGRPL